MAVKELSLEKMLLEGLPSPLPMNKRRVASVKLQEPVVGGLECAQLSFPSGKPTGLTADGLLRGETSASGSACTPGVGQGKSCAGISHGARVVPPKEELLCGCFRFCPIVWAMAPGQTGAGGGAPDSREQPRSLWWENHLQEPALLQQAGRESSEEGPCDKDGSSAHYADWGVQFLHGGHVW